MNNNNKILELMVDQYVLNNNLTCISLGLVSRLKLKNLQTKRYPYLYSQLGSIFGDSLGYNTMTKIQYTFNFGILNLFTF